MVRHSGLDSFMKELFTIENAVCVIIIALLLTIVVRKCKNEGFQNLGGAPYNSNASYNSNAPYNLNVGIETEEEE